MSSATDDRGETAITVTETSPASQRLSQPGPGDIIRQATEEASELSRVIEDRKLYSIISGRKYVKVEGWTTLAMMRGCMPREIETVEREDGCYVSRCELVRVADGAVLTQASAECGGPGERAWQKRAPYARRSMAQTRAAGKSCRIGFSWVMALAGYETTPAEEMEPQGTRGGRVRSDTGSRPASDSQLATLREFCDSPELPETKRENLRRAIEAGLTQQQAGALIAKASRAIQEVVNVAE